MKATCFPLLLASLLVTVNAGPAHAEDTIEADAGIILEPVYTVIRHQRADDPTRALSGDAELWMDVQCTENFENLCCQFYEEDPCLDEFGEPINGGPFLTDQENAADNDLILLNQYWNEPIPSDLSDSECLNYKMTMNAALRPVPGFLFYLTRNLAFFEDVCDDRGETLTFCAGGAFLPRDVIAGHQVPWAFSLETPTIPFRLEADFEGLDTTGESACIP